MRSQAESLPLIDDFDDAAVSYTDVNVRELRELKRSKVCVNTHTSWISAPNSS